MSRDHRERICRAMPDFIIELREMKSLREGRAQATREAILSAARKLFTAKAMTRLSLTRLPAPRG